jgi:hypothetical protein
MALREITDRFGKVWRVWEVRPGRLHPEIGYGRAWPVLDRRVAVRDRYQLGWLTFEAGRERRRFAPIPVAWDALDDETLLRLCEEAEPVERPGRVV